MRGKESHWTFGRLDIYGDITYNRYNRYKHQDKLKWYCFI